MNINITGDMFLATVQTITSAKTFNDGNLLLAGSTSGAATLKAPAVAGSIVVTLPAVTSTLATLGANTFTGRQDITQTVGAEGLVIAGGTQAASNPVLSLAQTWNNAAIPFSGIDLGVTDTACLTTSSSFLDLRSTITSARVRIGSNGWIYGNDASGTGSLVLTGSAAFGAVLFGSSSAHAIIDLSGIRIRNSFAYAWVASANATNGTPDTFLTRPAAATLQLGAAAAASPIAQALQAQGSRSGTDSNVGGGNLTVRSGLGTGTGTLSSLLLQSPVAPAGIGATAAQTQTTGLAILNGTAVLTSYTVANLPSASVSGAGATAFVTDASTTLLLGLGGTVAGGGANKVPVYSDGTNWIYG